jgi:hypothetical protein
MGVIYLLGCNATWMLDIFVNEKCIRVLLISHITQGQSFVHNKPWCENIVVYPIQHAEHTTYPNAKYLYSKRNEIIFVRWFVTSHVKSHEMWRCEEVSLKSLYECFFSLSPSLYVHDVSTKLMLTFANCKNRRFWSSQLMNLMEPYHHFHLITSRHCHP